MDRPALLAWLSKLQKTSSPTFQVAFWRTELPLAPLATVVPRADRSYFTVALVAEFSVTESTLETTAEASGLDEKALSEEANSEPFSSSCTRLLVGVLELKNVFQLVVISKMAADVPLVAGDVTAADGALGRTDDGAAEKDPCAFC
jgi:hypothetical protein